MDRMVSIQSRWRRRQVRVTWLIPPCDCSKVLLSFVVFLFLSVNSPLHYSRPIERYLNQ